MPVVYVDIVWVVNLVMDTVLLATTGWISKRPLQWRRLLWGGLIGSVYALSLFVPPLSPFTTWPGKAAVSLLMVWIAIPCRTWLELARVSVMYYFVSFVFAGAAIAMHYAIPGTGVGAGTIVEGKGFVFASGIGPLALLVAIPAAFGTLRFVVNRVKTLKTQAGSLYEVTVMLDGKTVNFTGLMDTGNQLRDPLSRKPVCLLEKELWLQLVPESLQSLIQSQGDPVRALSLWEGGAGQHRFALIPFKGAGSVSGLALGLRPDKVEIGRPGKTVRLAATCLFALHDGQLTADGRFQAILHTQMITGDDNLEEEPIASAAGSEGANSNSAHLDSH